MDRNYYQNIFDYIKKYFVVKSLDVNTNIESLEIIMKKHFVTICNNTQEYGSGYKSKRRMALVFIFKLFLVISILRISLSAIINKVL